MASGFFAVLDDIASLMDDIAVTSKIATRKTAGILGDDLAVNAEKATGFLSNRELPVLWAITKGSFLNKLIILPVVFLLNYYLPDAIKYILILGGFYLAYEGVEKIIHYLFHRKNHHPDKPAADATADDGTAQEKTKIKQAVTTDFILSIEIVIIALSSVLEKPLLTQIITVSIVAILATVGVYGLVALIVRMDDAGFSLIKRSKNTGFLSKLGKLLVDLLPWVIKSLAVIGTVALLMVSGGIFVHNINYLHHFLPSIPAVITEMLIGFAAGLLAFCLITVGQKLIGVFKKRPEAKNKK